MFSLRRVPALLALAVGTSKLDAALDAVLADPKYGAAGPNSCLVVQSGTYSLYSHNPTMPLLPASNLKLVTATAALEKVGANDHLVTTVKADVPPAQGTITGNLYLIGGGDPLLRTPDYVAGLHSPVQVFDNVDTLADQVRAAGVTTITGSVVGDDSHYDAQRSVPTWPSRYLSTGEVGPLSAVAINDGFSAFNPTLIPAPQPAQQAAATFTTLLQGRGITVTGPPQAGTAPATATPITQLSSAPLGSLLGEILRHSDNTGAEMITKELGRQANPATPTTAAGVAAIEATVAADGLPTTGLHMVDGSGLDRSDRATCQLMLALLQRSGPAGALAQSLPVAGTSGTLIGRMTGTPAAGRVRAKTGSLDGVSALSGYVAPPAASPSGTPTTASGGTAPQAATTTTTMAASATRAPATPTTATPAVATPTTATPAVATPAAATPRIATPTTATPSTATPAATSITPTSATPAPAIPTTATPAAAANSAGAVVAIPTSAGIVFSFIDNSASATALGDTLGDRIGVLLAEYPQVPSLAVLGPLPAP